MVTSARTPARTQQEHCQGIEIEGIDGIEIEGIDGIGGTEPDDEPPTETDTDTEPLDDDPPEDDELALTDTELPSADTLTSVLV